MASNSELVVTFLYPRKNLTKFDMDYYLKHHIPATEAGWGPLGMTNCIACSTEEDTEFVIKVITSWKNVASWDAAKGGKAASELTADVANFTNVKPVVVVGQVLGWFTN